MKKKFKLNLTFKIWLLIAVLILSLFSIFVGSGLTKGGLLVTNVASNSSLFEQGLRQGNLIVSIDGVKVNNLKEYDSILSGKFSSGKKVKTTISTKKNEYVDFSSEPPEISVIKLPDSNLKLGLDLAGGSRALIKAKNRSLSQADLTKLVEITSNRLNAFGLTDLKVAPVSDLSGNRFMLIEIAGATPKDLRKLISEQGKFEAKIGNETVFRGGNRDVASVGRDAQNARIESCGNSQGGEYVCRFSFSITLSGAAAKRQAEVTQNLPVNITPQGNYLSKKMDLILDGKQVSSLLIGEGLKGRVTTQIQISGSGSGATKDDAYADAKDQMKQLQTVLMTGSLPFKLQIVKLDTISPLLGEEFINSIFLAGLVAILMVSLIIFIRYRDWKISLAMISTMVSEVIIILGVAAMIGWNLDLPGIAGILATIGTGVDDLVVILDESKVGIGSNLKQKLKGAFVIIMGAYFTSFVSLLPLMWAGAGLLKGFAVTTIIGISVGVFITRPAFGDMIRKFKERK